MKAYYKGKEIVCEDGVISAKHNSEMWKVLSNFLFTSYGYDFDGGSVEGERVYIGVSLMGTGQEQLAQHIKHTFNFKELILNGQIY